MECFFCERTTPPLIKSTRIAGFQEASRQRDDGLCQKLPINAEFITCHKNCMSTYCSKDHIQRVLKKRKSEKVPEAEPKRLRGITISFDFREQCFFCGESCSVETPKKHPKRWRKAYLCRTGDEKGKKTSKDELEKRAKERGDNWGREVISRLSSAVSDLHAADARYHRDCYSRFYTNNPSQSTGSNDNAVNLLVDEMLSNKSRMWNSVEVYERYLELGGEDKSRRTLLNCVSEKLQPDLMILSSPGVASIFVFRTTASAQLRIVNEESDCVERAIACLASAIKSECPTFNRQTYPTRLSRESVINECSPTLLALLAAIDQSLNFTLPATMISHIVTSAVTNSFTNLQLGISVMLSRQRKLIDELHTYGVTTSYKELRRFRCSAAVTMASVPRGLAQFESKNGLVQVVADNFDTQISSPNGQKSTHGLAMILTQANRQRSQPTFDQLNSPNIRRLSTAEMKSENMTLKYVTVHRYTGSKKPPMPKEHSLRPVPSLSFLAKRQMSLSKAESKDLSFFKQVLREDPGPEYGGYNTQQARLTGQQSRPRTDIVYTPFLDMVPSEPDTMKTAMVEAQHLTQLTGQEWTIFTSDQQLYKELVHITWTDKEQFEKFIPRLGGMHMLMSFVGAVGFLMGGSGIEEILASTFAGVPKMLSGKKYPQNVRALRLLVEELLRPILSNTDVPTMADLMKLLVEKSTQSKTAKLWIECLIEPVFLMMTFIRAEREADWALHLFAVEKTIPYFFASGHINYARYGLYYLRSMQRLHPDVTEKFMAGEHAMHHQEGLWNGVWSDLFIETTYMRYGHGPSGIIGSTLNESTLAIWAYSHSTLTQLLNDLQEIKDGSVQTVVSTHKEERHTRIREDAEDRAKLRDILSTCIDILDTKNHPEASLINVFSGQVIDDKTVNVHSALQVGIEEQQAFEDGWPGSFHLKLTKRIKNMTAAMKAPTKCAKYDTVIDAELTYARVLGIMATSRESVSIEALFSHEMSLYPTALFDEHRDMRTTSKAALKNKIQVLCGVRRLDSPTVIILDGCAILWTVPWPASPAKVSVFISAAVHTILRRVQPDTVSHVVFDRYFKLSTKSCCRTIRQNGNSRVYNLTEESPLPQQSIMLKVASNKEQLIQMIVNRLCSMQPPPTTDVVITGLDPHPVHMGSRLQETHALHHEEADVLMAFHVINEASMGQRHIRVVSDDTDVLVILAHHLYMETKVLTQNVTLTMESCTSNHNVISVNDVVRKHAKILPNLLAAHALSGCDTVSSFSGIGKVTVLKKLETFTEDLKLGDTSADFPDIQVPSLQFIALLYGDESETNLNTLRASIFRKRIAGKRHIPPKLSSLPPTMAGVQAHIKRAHFQTALWKSAGEPSPPRLNPVDFGWEMHMSTLRPALGLDDQLPVPNEVLHLVNCSCKTGCSTTHCSCNKLSLTCTIFCKCKASGACRNPLTVHNPPCEDDI